LLKVSAGAIIFLCYGDPILAEVLTGEKDVYDEEAKTHFLERAAPLVTYKYRNTERFGRRGGTTPLMYVVRFLPSAEHLELLVREATNELGEREALNHQDDQGSTVVHVCVSVNAREQLKVLLKFTPDLGLKAG
jgi:hypothetical protein